MSVLLGPDDVLPLLQARVADVAPAALVVGDPARAALAASLLTDVREVGSNREFVTHTGIWNDVPVTVASHGVGSAGAAVCFEELLRAGVNRVVRAGTAGGLQPDVTDGHLVVATGAVREDGVTPRLVAPEYPAVADAGLVRALSAALDRRPDVHRGIVLTCDLFYPLPMLGTSLPTWAQAGVVAVEMELSVLLVLASLRGVAAGGVFAIDGNPVASADMADYQPHRDVVRTATEAAVRAGLDALTAG